jgi:hypothetical protein
VPRDPGTLHLRAGGHPGGESGGHAVDTFECNTMWRNATGCDIVRIFDRGLVSRCSLSAWGFFPWAVNRRAILTRFGDVLWPSIASARDCTIPGSLLLRVRLPRTWKPVAARDGNYGRTPTTGRATRVIRKSAELLPSSCRLNPSRRHDLILGQYAFGIRLYRPLGDKLDYLA